MKQQQRTPDNELIWKVRYCDIKYWIDTPEGEAAVLAVRPGAEIMIVYPIERHHDHMHATMRILTAAEWRTGQFVRRAQ